MYAHDFGVTRLFLEFFGEPLLHPNFDEMVINTKKFNFKTQVCTKGIYVNKKHLEVIPNNLNAVCFLIDGASKETYNLNRQPVNPRTKNNYKYKKINLTPDQKVQNIIFTIYFIIDRIYLKLLSIINKIL